MRANTRRKGSFTFVEPDKNGSKLLKNHANVSKLEHGIYKRQTNRWMLVVWIGLIFPTLAMYPYDDGNDGKVDVVVIDAGHGGKDPGNLGTRRHRKTEKDVALATALLVGKYIEENIEGVEVIYTRDDDTFLELYERTALANRANADLFISIHCNAGVRSAYGSETYVMGWTRAEENLEVSKRENSVILLEENYEENYEGFDPNSPVNNIAVRLAQSAYLNQSVDFATLVQDQFRDRVKRRDRGVKQSVLYVLDYTAMPSVLIELGFLTNSGEEDFLLSTNGQELMASAIYRAFKDYKIKRDALDEGIQIEQLPVDPEEPEEQVLVVVDPDPVFKVQIAVSSSLKECIPENFGGLETVSYYKEGRLYKYTYGEYNSLQDAREAQSQARAAGFGDAYIIAFKGDDKISVSEAERLLQ